MKHDEIMHQHQLQYDDDDNDDIFTESQRGIDDVLWNQDEGFCRLFLFGRTDVLLGESVPVTLLLLCDKHFGLDHSNCIFEDIILSECCSVSMVTGWFSRNISWYLLCLSVFIVTVYWCTYNNLHVWLYPC